ncbi:hypothetical protein BB560_006995 [Smittium megazygosporum]|uniref:PCI domain-containing protein n=1 Tax=Smittium megazygosporum TaxID=133381 RepID=A0A2T9XZN3_9FUNG|nr:hypothetical protein BB560_006995 [Smittium megazygosporum]
MLQLLQPTDASHLFESTEQLIGSGNLVDAKQNISKLKVMRIFEQGAEYELQTNNLKDFEDYMQKLFVYYFAENSVANKSNRVEYKRQNYFIGLYLVVLLCENRISDFHVLIERLEGEAKENEYVEYAQGIEQCLMEGSYKRVYNSQTVAPAPAFRHLVDTRLLVAIRNDIAQCASKAYSRLPIDDAKTLLFCNDYAMLEQIAKHHNWTINHSDRHIYFAANNESKLKNGINGKQIEKTNISTTSSTTGNGDHNKDAENIDYGLEDFSESFENRFEYDPMVKNGMKPPIILPNKRKYMLLDANRTFRKMSLPEIDGEKLVNWPQRTSIHNRIVRVLENIDLMINCAKEVSKPKEIELIKHIYENLNYFDSYKMAITFAYFVFVALYFDNFDLNNPEFIKTVVEKSLAQCSVSNVDQVTNIIINIATESKLLKQETMNINIQAAEMGLFGIPTFSYNSSNTFYWGNDHMIDVAIEALESFSCN